MLTWTKKVSSLNYVKEKFVSYTIHLLLLI